jgi:hypothetical protein
MAKTVPNFGQIYKANAAGYKWAPEFRLFIRIVHAGNFFKVEIQPPTFDASIFNDWIIGSVIPAWHTQEGMLTFAPVLNKYMGRATPFTFYMDEDGMELPTPIKGTVYAVPAGEYKKGEKLILDEKTKTVIRDKEGKPLGEGIPQEFKGSK